MKIYLGRYISSYIPSLSLSSINRKTDTVDALSATNVLPKKFII